MTLLNLDPVEEKVLTEEEIEAQKAEWEAKKITLVKKAKEILEENGAMESPHLLDALEFYCVYGKMPVMTAGVPQTTGEKIGLADGHTSDHLPSKKLKEIINQVEADLASE